MKIKRFITAFLAIILCMSATTVGLYASATESDASTEAQASDADYSTDGIYATFGSAENKTDYFVCETNIVKNDTQNDWHNLNTYNDQWRTYKEWDNVDGFELNCKLTTYYGNWKAVMPKYPVFYVVGYNGERIGTEDDESIISDLLADGHIVVVADFLGCDATLDEIACAAAVLSRDLANYGNFVGDDKYLYSSENATLKNLYKIDTVVIPAGYRFVRGEEFFDITKHAAKGTMDLVVAAWNNDKTKAVVEAAKIPYAQATGYDGIIMPNGKPITDIESGNYARYLTYKLDVCYPSIPKDGYEAPVFVNASTAGLRYQFGEMAANAYAGIMAMLEGYAYSFYDHEHTPFTREEGCWTIDGITYTVNTYNSVRFASAAMRKIKYLADEYGYSKEKLGALGHSRTSVVVALSNPDPTVCYEFGYNSKYAYTLDCTDGVDEQGNFLPQPTLTYKDGTPISSDISCVYHSMGFGSIYHAQMLTPASVPTIICCGAYDYGNAFEYWEQEYKNYSESGIPFAAFYMPDEGHTRPPYKRDPIYGYNYYIAMRAFFNYHLGGRAPEVMYDGIEVDGTVDIDDKGLFIYFSAPITEWSLLKGVSVTDASGNAVKGTWLADCGGSRWYFETDNFAIGSEYTLTLADGTAADIDNKAVAEGFTKTFTVK